MSLSKGPHVSQQGPHHVHRVVIVSTEGSKHPWAIKIRKLKSTAELHTRIEELKMLKDQTQAMGISIADAVSDRASILDPDTDPFPSGNIYS